MGFARALSAIASSPGSTRPPGKATCPACVRKSLAPDRQKNAGLAPVGDRDEHGCVIEAFGAENRR